MLGDARWCVSLIVCIYLLGGWSCDGAVPYGPQYSARQLLNSFVHWRVSKMDVRGNRTIYKSSVHSSPEERVASCQDITVQLERINGLDIFSKMLERSRKAKSGVREWRKEGRK